MKVKENGKVHPFFEIWDPGQFDSQRTDFWGLTSIDTMAYPDMNCPVRKWVKIVSLGLLQCIFDFKDNAVDLYVRRYVNGEWEDWNPVNSNTVNGGGLLAVLSGLLRILVSLRWHHVKSQSGQYDSRYYHISRLFKGPKHSSCFGKLQIITNGDRLFYHTRRSGKCQMAVNPIQLFGRNYRTGKTESRNEQNGIYKDLQIASKAVIVC